MIRWSGDENTNYDATEDRFYALGKSIYNNLLLVCFCERNGDTIRYILQEKQIKRKRRIIMQAINNDPLNETKRVNWKITIKNPYVDNISNEERVEMVLDLLYEDCKMFKEDFKVLVDKSLVSLS